MSDRPRLVMLGTLLVAGTALLATLYQAKLSTPMRSTLTSSFQILGVPLKLVDRAASRVLPVDELDEKSLGDVYRKSYDPQTVPPSREQRYLDSLVEELSPFAARDFPYRVYVVDYPTPNAMALPGGIVLVTRELLSTLKSENELFAVLAHEIGHIELGHCFDAVRFELLSRKLGAESLGQIADMSAQLLLRHSYSKTMEHEADEYAFELLTNSRYDPRGVGHAFDSLEAYLETRGGRMPMHAIPLRDYFSSHPPLPVRADEFTQRADAWWRRHRDERRYVGRKNLSARVSLVSHPLDAEWTGP